MIKRPKASEARKLYRVILRAREYLGTAEQWHAKVVASDFMAALLRALEDLEIEPAQLDGSAVTLIAESTELDDGKVFDVARRARAFGERGAWIFREDLPERSPKGPRQTPLL